MFPPGELSSLSLGPKGFLLLLTLVAAGEAEKIGVEPPASLVNRNESFAPTGLTCMEKGVLRWRARSPSGPCACPGTNRPGYGRGWGTGAKTAASEEYE